MKKFGLFFIVLALFFSTCTVSVNGVFTLSYEEEAGAFLYDIGIFKGYPDGTLRLEMNIKRAEFCTLIVRLLNSEDDIRYHITKDSFVDVEKDFWGRGFVNTASELGFVLGYEDGSFKPNNNITYAEAITILLRVLDEEKNIADASNWPYAYIEKATDLGLTVNMMRDASHIVNRGEVAALIYNSLPFAVEGEVSLNEIFLNTSFSLFSGKLNGLAHYGGFIVELYNLTLNECVASQPVMADGSFVVSDFSSLLAFEWGYRVVDLKRNEIVELTRIGE